MAERRRLVSSVGAFAAVTLVVAAGVVAVRGRGGGAGDANAGRVAGPDAPTAAAKATATADTDAPAPLAAGSTAVVDVAVASLWASPGQARPLDAPSLGNPVDVDAWLSAMTTADRLWLVDKLVTQALYGERVRVDTIQGDWAKVVVLDQPSSQDDRGYPGWLPTVQLRAAKPGAPQAAALVSAHTTTLRDAADPTRPLLELSFGTRLAVVDAGKTWITVATPEGGRAVVAPSDVELAAPDRPAATGLDLVRTAQAFSGLPYLWAGTSAYGFDCSGFTMLVYAAHGISIPRDADDQATTGTAVDPSHLQPGDLLFYATDEGRGSIHHVSMYVGNGLMIQSPATGRTVETIPVDTPAYARELWGARRYLPSPDVKG